MPPHIAVFMSPQGELIRLPTKQIDKVLPPSDRFRMPGVTWRYGDGTHAIVRTKDGRAFAVIETVREAKQMAGLK